MTVKRLTLIQICVLEPFVCKLGRIKSDYKQEEKIACHRHRLPYRSVI